MPAEDSIPYCRPWCCAVFQACPKGQEGFPSTSRKSRMVPHHLTAIAKATFAARARTKHASRGLANGWNMLISSQQAIYVSRTKQLSLLGFGFYLLLRWLPPSYGTLEPFASDNLRHSLGRKICRHLSVRSVFGQCASARGDSIGVAKSRPPGQAAPLERLRFPICGPAWLRNLS